MKLSWKPELCIKLLRKPIHYTCSILKKIIRPKGRQKKKINTCSQRFGKKTLLPIWPKFFIGPFQKSKPPPEYQMDRAVYTTQEREREREREREIGCLTSHATIFQSYM